MNRFHIVRFVHFPESVGEKRIPDLHRVMCCNFDTNNNLVGLAPVNISGEWHEVSQQLWQLHYETDGKGSLPVRVTRECMQRLHKDAYYRPTPRKMAGKID